MIRLTTPPLPEVMRTPTGSVGAAMVSLKDFYETRSNFNYLDSTKRVKSSYKGLHDFDVLISGMDGKKVGCGPNKEVVTLAAPLAFGRKTQVFDLPSRKFPFGRDRLSSYRVPFFFVEGGVVKVYMLLPRKGPYLSYDAVCGCATVLKRYLLEQEFYGERIDVEIVDVSALEKDGPRVLQKYCLSDLELWPDARLHEHLKGVAVALDAMERDAIVKKNRRIRLLRDSELPLFD
jgi:hypothetical protein